MSGLAILGASLPDATLRATLGMIVALIPLLLLTRWLSAAARCLLWRLVLVKAAISVLPLSLVLSVPVTPAPMVRVPLPPTPPVLAARAPESVVSVPLPTPAHALPEPRLAALLGALYLLGVGACLVRLGAGWRWRRRVLADCRLQHGHGSAPPIALSPSGAGPFVTGIARPVVVVPEALWGQLDDTDRRLLLAHEEAHVQRRDLLWGEALSTLIGSVLWFHPLVWWVRRCARQAQEEAADARALSQTNLVAARYGRMLVTVARWHTAQGNLLCADLSSPARGLERRLHALASAGQRSRRIAAGALVLALIALVPLRLLAQAPPDRPPTPLLPDPRNRYGLTKLVVLDASGRPAASAECLLWTEPQDSSSTGWHLWPDGTHPLPVSGSDLTVLVRYPGQSGRVTLNAATVKRRTEMRLHPAPSATITGTVTDSRGQPVPGALVAYRPGGPWLQFPIVRRRPADPLGPDWVLFPREGSRPIGWQTARTDAQGRFVLSGVWPEEPGWLVAASPGWTGAQVPLTPRPGASLSVRLPLTHSGSTLQGRVVDPAGKPVAGAVVRLHGPASYQETISDAAGNYRLTDLEAALCIATVSHSGRALSGGWRIPAGLHEANFALSLRRYPAGSRGYGRGRQW
jgi:beta-lactamase regulating signal transducer with metallopeptidase domain